MFKGLRTEEYKRNMSEVMKLAWSKTGLKEKQSEVMKCALDKPGLKMSRAKLMKEVMNRAEVKVKVSEASKISNNKPEVNEKRVRAFKQTLSNSELRAKWSKAAKENWSKDPGRKDKQKEFMLNGHASYMLSLSKNPSWPQIKTYKNVCSVVPSAILNYPICVDKGKWYSLDVAVPQLGIAIEYDGSFFHKDKSKEEKRQKEVEEEGWRFLRYRDHVPTIEQLKNDINSVIGVIYGT